jgi:hypothetical protein
VSPDTKLVVLFGALHLIALGLVAGLLVIFIRSETVEAWRPPEEDDGWGDGGSRLEPTPRAPRTPGGLPLPDAAPARVRLREPGRLAERVPRPERRPAREPAREPVPSR